MFIESQANGEDLAYGLGEDLPDGWLMIAANEFQATSSDAFEEIPGSGDQDSIDGGDAAEWIYLGGNGDLCHAGAGADSIDGGDGNDLIYGNQGADTINGDDGDDIVYAGKDADLINGGLRDDHCYGNLADDTMNGDEGNDTLHGGQGADLIQGGDGDDWLAGLRDNDTLSGGAGADLFWFRGPSGDDLVTDFNGAEDRMLFRTEESGFASLSDVQAAAEQGDGQLVLTLANGATITLLGVTLSDLTADNLLFYNT